MSKFCSKKMQVPLSNKEIPPLVPRALNLDPFVLQPFGMIFTDFNITELPIAAWWEHDRVKHMDCHESNGAIAPSVASLQPGSENIAVAMFNGRSVNISWTPLSSTSPRFRPPSELPASLVIHRHLRHLWIHLIRRRLRLHWILISPQWQDQKTWSAP